MSILNWLNDLDVKATVATLAGIGTGGFGVFKVIRKYSLSGYVRRILNLEPGMEDLKAAMDNMSNIVSSQGQSVDWLTQQLTQYREDLDMAREKLKEMEEMHIENTALKIRVQELESQVKALEEDLARRKKYTPKKYKEAE
jgi:predicted RNase H-like nuclease (RuvC/YqgF family)